MEYGKMTVNEVADRMEINQSNVSRHLNLLKRAGVAQNKKRGRETFYSLNFENINYRLGAILGIIGQCCDGDSENKIKKRG